MRHIKKKKEYGHGLLVVKNFDIDNFSVKWIKDKESTIIVDNLSQDKETKEILSIVNEKKLFLLK